MPFSRSIDGRHRTRRREQRPRPTIARPSSGTPSGPIPGEPAAERSGGQPSRPRLDPQPAVRIAEGFREQTGTRENPGDVGHRRAGDPTELSKSQDSRFAGRLRTSTTNLTNPDESGHWLRLAVPGVARKERGLLVTSPSDRFVRFVRFVVASLRFSLQPTSFAGGDSALPYPGGLGPFVVAMALLA